MNRSYRYVLCVSSHFLFMLTTKLEWVIPSRKARSLLLRRFRTMILLSRPSRLEFNFLYRYLSPRRFDPSSGPYLLRPLLWSWIHVSWGVHKSSPLLIKHVCNKCCVFICKLRLLFDYAILRMYWAFFPSLSQFLFNPSLYHQSSSKNFCFFTYKRHVYVHIFSLNGRCFQFYWPFSRFSPNTFYDVPFPLYRELSMTFPHFLFDDTRTLGWN